MKRASSTSWIQFYFIIIIIIIIIIIAVVIVILFIMDIIDIIFVIIIIIFYLSDFHLSIEMFMIPMMQISFGSNRAICSLFLRRYKRKKIICQLSKVASAAFVNL